MGMKIQTFSVIIGDTSCNANCPFCVSKMTPECGVDEYTSEHTSINLKNFRKSCQFAKDSRVSTVLMTGKGEPLLKRNRKNLFLHLNVMSHYNFPFVEIQTNGTEVMNMSEERLNKSIKDLWKLK